MEHRRLSISYIALQGSYFMLYSAVFCYASVFLQARGFQPGRIGVIIAWGNILAVILQTMVASAVDRSRQFTLKNFMTMVMLVTIILLSLLVLLPKRKIITAGFMIMILGVASILQPLVNAVSGYYNKKGYQINYGAARGMGSFTYAVIAYFLGFIVMRRGEGIILIAAIWFALLVLGVLFLFQMSPEPQYGKEGKDKKKSGFINLVKKYKTYFIMLSGVVFLFTFLNMTSTYMIHIMEYYGGNSSDMGFSAALAAVSELPMMLLFYKVIKKIRANNLLKLSAAGFLAKAISFYFSGNILSIHFSQLFQAVSYAVFMPAAVCYSDELMEEEDRVKGQSMIIAATTVGGIIGNFTGGRIIDLFGIPAMLLTAVLCAAVGMGIVLISAVPVQRK